MLNGAIPPTLLRPIPWSPSKFVILTALDAVTALGQDFRKYFGYFPAITDAYRTLARQEELFDEYGYPRAAYPGTSNHGYGLSIDFGSGINVYNSSQWLWMNDHGRRHGFRPLNENNHAFEPWHWTYTGDETDPVPPAPEPAPEPVPEPRKDDDMAFTATGPNGQVWHISGLLRRPITQDIANHLSVLAPPATVPYLGGIDATTLAGYADIGGQTRAVTVTES